MSKKYRIGIDIGGTNVKFAIVDLQGKIIYSNSVMTHAELGYESALNNIKQAIYTAFKETKVTKENIEGMGIGFPGQIDSEKGIVRNLPNMPGWENVPVAKIMETEFGFPTKIDNDVRCAALGELNFGAGKGCKNLVCITVGTGVGSAIVANGQLVRGASMAAGELGHMTLLPFEGPICGCGDTGCLEALASGPSIVAMAEEYILGGKSTKYKELAAAGPITPYLVYEAAKQGDAVAKRIFTLTGEWLGIALSNVVNLLNPEKIVIGGGVAQAGDLLFDPIREVIKKRTLKVSGDAVKVVPAELGESAGVVGASLLVNS